MHNLACHSAKEWEGAFALKARSKGACVKASERDSTLEPEPDWNLPRRAETTGTGTSPSPVLKSMAVEEQIKKQLSGNNG